MPGVVESNGTTYISSHSADVILSDIRPFKLKSDALLSINVLLDELLYTILNTSNSLITDRLRAGLLTLLPTSLGKEALLEAEVELRAYWERTAASGVVPSLADDTATFHPQWAFELLRNKCEAYSTLNEADEDPSAETRINERFGRTGSSPPNAALVPPAALYLTAILEAVCEHVLSNVGRVAARDSSRTTATVNDLFTALCEDASIYPYFRTMKVYEQIEQLSRTPRTSRRSKSFTRNEKASSISRTMSPNHDGAPQTASFGSLSRQSSEASSVANTHVHTPSRSSFDKSRALRLFTNGKASHEKEESQATHGHRKSVSLGENARKSYDSEPAFAEDPAMLQEFDDLMRSASTMKMSLTPDRLKTMEVFKQEKDQRGQRRPPPLATRQNSDAPSPRSIPLPLPSARQVESIVEDDEEGSSPKTSHPKRQGINHSQPPAVLMSSANRARSLSTSSPLAKKPPRVTPPVPSSFPASLHTSASNPNMGSTTGVNNQQALNGAPTRKKTKQRNAADIDLDEILNGSDHDQADPKAPSSRPPGALKKRTHKVSATTRDLMDFLAEGPPEAPDVGMRDFLAEGPPTSQDSTPSSEKPKAGRLQRMMSKLNMGNEKSKTSNEIVGKTTGHYRTVAGTQQTTHAGAFSPLANRPIPPRPPLPPQPISPPPSPTQASIDDNNARPTPTPAQQRVPALPDQSRVSNASSNSIPPSPSRSPTIPQQQMPKSIMKEVPSTRSIPHQINGNGSGNGNAHTHTKSGSSKTLANVQPDVPVSSTSQTRSLRKPVPTDDGIVHAERTQAAHIPAPLSSQAHRKEQPEAPVIPENDWLDMQRLFASATTADECRLIFDMFMARNKIKAGSLSAVTAYPSPSPSLIKQSSSSSSSNCKSSTTAPVSNTDVSAKLENSVVELLLGGSSVSVSSSRSGSVSSVVSHSQSQSHSQSPTPPPRARKLPRVPAPDPSTVILNSSPVPKQQRVVEQQEKVVPVTQSWKNSAEFQTHTGTLIPA